MCYQTFYWSDDICLQHRKLKRHLCHVQKPLKPSARLADFRDCPKFITRHRYSLSSCNRCTPEGYEVIKQRKTEEYRSPHCEEEDFFGAKTEQTWRRIDWQQGKIVEKAQKPDVEQEANTMKSSLHVERIIQGKKTRATVH